MEGFDVGGYAGLEWGEEPDDVGFGVGCDFMGALNVDFRVDQDVDFYVGFVSAFEGAKA